MEQMKANLGRARFVHRKSSNLLKDFNTYKYLLTIHIDTYMYSY